MRRIIAEIMESTDLGKQPDDTGLPWRDVRCLVKLKSSVPESHHLPDDIKDTTLTVRRRALFDHEYGPGMKLVLTPEECGQAVARHADTPEFGSLKGRCVTYRTDINGDGFPERAVENSFLRIVIGPRFGARIWEMWHKGCDWNPLNASYDFSQDWFEIGGQEDHISEQGGQGEFWNAKFEEKEVTCDEKGFRATYEFKSEKSKGITFAKEITLPPDAPLVHFRCTFKYAGAEKPPEDGKPDEFEMTFWPRVGVAVPEEEKASWVFLIPTKRKLHRLRRYRSWHEPRGFDMSAPYHLAQDEDTGRCLALLLDPEQTYFGEIKEGRSHFETIEPKMKQVKVPKDGERSYGFALVVGDWARADQNGLAITATGQAEDGELPHFALTAGKTKPIRRKPTFERKATGYAGLPRILHDTVWVPYAP